ncbi:MAG: hypothetical protein HOW73_32265 [Polyangiaceae bacterium]|nr:hypothetical protein [Polyangiaceae bacterium]
MWKHVIATKDRDGTERLFFAYSGFDPDVSRYVTSIFAEEIPQAFLSSSPMEGATRAVYEIRELGFEIVEGPTLVAKSRVRIHAFNGKAYIRSFGRAAELAESLLRQIAEAQAGGVRGLLERSSHPIIAGFGRDQTLEWDREVLQDAQEVLADTTRDGQPPVSDYWTTSGETATSDPVIQ